MTLPDRSVTLRLFVELLLAPGGALSFDELTARYGVRTMIGVAARAAAVRRAVWRCAGRPITLLPRGESFGRAVTGRPPALRITSAN